MGQIGTGNTSDQHSFVQVIPSGVTAISANFASLAIVNGKVFFTGDGYALGQSNVSTWTDTGLSATMIRAGHTDFYAVSNGTLFITGTGSAGEFGLGNYNHHFTWTTTGKTAQYIDGGNNFSVYLNNGILYSTGRDMEYQLGRGETGGGINSFGAATGQGASNVAAVSTGANFTLILKNDGKVYGVGYNSFGALGTGSSGNVLSSWTAAQYP